ncbi:MAG: hypothetical protein KGZ82_10940 [Bacteroidales bacterium]|nr:hypothetical protein [Bacteroidales bacterium]
MTIDGKNLQPADGQLTAAINLSHGKHMLQIEKVRGMFKSEKEFESYIDVPGGYVVKARYADKQLNIFETVPFAGEMVNSLIQTHDLNDSQGQKPVIINGQQEQLSSATQATHQTDLQRPASNDPASISFLSKKSLCDIYLNGEQKLSLGISPIDGLAQTSIEIARPVNYLLKIAG